MPNTLETSTLLMFGRINQLFAAPEFWYVANTLSPVRVICGKEMVERDGKIWITQAAPHAGAK